MRHIVVVGDLIIDEDVFVDSVGPSSCEGTETWRVIDRKCRWGGAGLVVRHLLRLGCRVTFVTMSGEDDPLALPEVFDDCPDGDEMARLDVFEVPFDGWTTTRKVRYYDGGEKRLKVNSPNKGRHSDKTRYLFVDDGVCDLFLDADALVIWDGGHGTLDEPLARDLVSLFKKEGKEVFVNCQNVGSERYEWYRAADYVFVNEEEEKRLPFSADDEPFIVVTRGKKGAKAYRGCFMYNILGIQVDVVDTLGAGDAFMSAFVASENDDIRGRLEEANTWAAKSCMEPGTRVPKREEEKK